MGQVFTLSLRENGPSLIGDNCSADAIAKFRRHRVLPLTCYASFVVENEVKVEDVLSVKAEFDAKSGSYQCVVKPVGSCTPSSSILDTHVILTAQYAGAVTAQISIPFYPSVFIQTTEVHVSDLQPNTHLVIIGKPSILQVIDKLRQIWALTPQHESKN